MKVTLYSMDAGGHDEEWPVVDQTDLPAGWELEVDRRRWTVDGGTVRAHRLEGRYWKTHPHEVYPDSTVTIWVDACLEITSPTFVAEILDQLRAKTISLFIHPDRTTVEQEIEAADTLEKYAGLHDVHREMVRDLMAHSVPASAERHLWAMTVIAAPNTLRTKWLNEAVWGETMKWSQGADQIVLDQLILPFILQAMNIEPIPLMAPPERSAWPVEGARGNLWANDWFVRHPHLRET